MVEVSTTCGKSNRRHMVPRTRVCAIPCVKEKQHAKRALEPAYFSPTVTPVNSLLSLSSSASSEAPNLLLSDSSFARRASLDWFHCHATSSPRR